MTLNINNRNFNEKEFMERKKIVFIYTRILNELQWQKKLLHMLKMLTLAFGRNH